jgi:hypothetical protein
LRASDQIEYRVMPHFRDQAGMVAKSAP